ncbi:hypothetical protein BJV78DRAFT_1378358 [Lactifluus subvellereus]|nr:hypothetical protein BJV78DRAFT_1378358 [Lactifluus subvellereus]
MDPTAPVNSQQQQHKTHRLRGGGAARNCFLGMVECFICYECCKVRLIIACPHPCCHHPAPPSFNLFLFLYSALPRGDIDHPHIGLLRVRRRYRL